MNKKVLGLIAALSANVIWGFVSIAFRFLKQYPTDLILTYRIIIAFIFTWFFILVFNKKKLKDDLHNISLDKNIKKQKFWLLLVLSGICITANWFAFIYVVNTINIKSAAFAYMICPLITALGGFILLKEKLSKLNFIALGIALFSILLLGFDAYGSVLWSALIASFYASFLITQRVIKDFDRLNMLGFQLMVGLIVILPLLIFHPQTIPLQWSFWVAIGIIGLLFTLIPLLLSLYAVANLPSSTVGIILYINPIVAFCIAFFYFDESIKANQVFSYILLIVAIIVFNWNIILNSIFQRNKQKN